MIRTLFARHLDQPRTSVQRTAKHLLDVQREHPRDWTVHVLAKLHDASRYVRDDHAMENVVVIVGTKLVYLVKLHSETAVVIREAL